MSLEIKERILLNFSINIVVFWFDSLYTQPTIKFFRWGTIISKKSDSITSGSENLHSSRSLYWRPFCKLISTPPPVYDLRWLETKWYPVVFTNSAVQSVNQVSDTPVTEKGMLRFLSNKLRGCPREHWAVVLHAISPISMKLCQLIGSTQKLKKTNWFLFGFFPGGR